MTFHWETTYYPTTLDLVAALPPVPAWAKSITFHHTWKPTEATWRGQRSMEALKRFYAGKGWKAGPHLFVAPDGVWGGTPLTAPGTHAGTCNAHSIGVEIVGDFDAAPWPTELSHRLHDLFVRLLHWLKTDETQLRGHRECLPNKSCPGKMVDCARVRGAVRRLIFTQRFIVTTPVARVRASPTINSVRLGTQGQGSILPAHPVRGRAIEGVDGWARVLLPNGATGYIFGALGRMEAV